MTITDIEYSINEHVDNMANNREICEDFYNEYISCNIELQYDTINIADFDCEYIDFILKDFHYNTEEINDTDKLEIIIYVLGRGYSFLNVTQVNWNEVIRCFIEYKMTELFEGNYYGIVERHINEYHKRLVDINDFRYTFAIRKILQSRVYNTGLGLKLNLRNAMNDLTNIIK